MNTLDCLNINNELSKIDSQFKQLETKEFTNWNWTKDLMNLAETGLTAILEKNTWLNECQLIFQDNQLFIKQPNNIGILVSIYHVDYNDDIVTFLKTKNLNLSDLTGLKTSLILFLGSLEQGIDMLTQRGLNIEDGLLSYGYDYNRSFQGRKLVPIPMKSEL